MKPAVYLESSIISYLAGRPSRDVITLALQQLTLDWWTTRRHEFGLVASELVIKEVAAGDPDVARRRLELLKGIPLLDISEAAIQLAEILVRDAGLPKKAGADALHIATAACHGVQYLLTWNSKHIANAEHRPRVERSCRNAGYEPPVLCTPDELMGGEDRA
jgi:predicted nucleic acid-binding protein